MRANRKQPHRPRPVPDEMGDYLDLRITGDYFERDECLSRLLELWHKGKNPLWICCEPGGGGTTFAKELAWSITKRPDGEIRHRLPDKTFLLTYKGSIFNTICDFYIPGYVFRPYDAWTTSEDMVMKQRYQDKLQLLQAYLPKDSVLIVDGVDDVFSFELDSKYADLMALGTVIIVSNDTKTEPDWVIEPLSEADHRGQTRKQRALNDGEQIILQNASLLPITGLNMLVFLRAQGSEKKETVLNLINEGLLEESVSVGIMPSNMAYSGNDEDYRSFLEHLKKRADSATLSTKVYDQITHCFKNAAHILCDADGNIALTAGKLFRNRGDLLEAIPMYELYLEKQEKLESKDYTTLANALYEVGCINLFKAITSKEAQRETYLETGKAMLSRALAYQEKYLDRGSRELAHTRMTLAQLCYETHDLKTADAICELAIKEQLAVLPLDHYDLGVTYLEAAMLHRGRFAERKRRQEYAEKALAILEQHGSRDKSLADVYCVLQGCLPVYDYDGRIRFEQMALEIYEKYYPNHKWWRYSSHTFLAHLEGKRGNTQGQVQNLNDALQILLEMLPPEHLLIMNLKDELKRAGK